MPSGSSESPAMHSGRKTKTTKNVAHCGRSCKLSELYFAKFLEYRSPRSDLPWPFPPIARCPVAEVSSRHQESEVLTPACNRCAAMPVMQMAKRSPPSTCYKLLHDRGVCRCRKLKGSLHGTHYDVAKGNHKSRSWSEATRGQVPL